ncbi:MAG: redoxin domain-containing protein [Solirubrobacteraceae bacterium]
MPLRPGIAVDVTGRGVPGLSLLRGQLIPDVELDSASGRPFDFVAHARLLIYMYPGAAGMIRGDETSLIDAEQHRAFRDRCDDFTACGFTVVGISSQSVVKQQSAVEVHELLHELLSDPDFLLADELGVPTRRLGAVRVYERATLLVRSGWINQVLSPQPTPDLHPTYVAHLLRRQG